MIYRHYTESPIGALTLESEGEAVTGIFFPGQVYKTLTASCLEGDKIPVLMDAARQLQEYFGGWRKQFDFPLAVAGTVFKKQVWAALQEIPFGQTVSYGDLARSIGNPLGVRAVGLANGRNPVSIVLPCHRVIGADGSLTGYGGGLDRKKFLLALEGSLATGRSRKMKNPSPMLPFGPG